MVTTLDRLVVINNNALYNMTRSVVGSTGREVLGDLIGKKYRGNYLLDNAYTPPSIVREPMSVHYGDDGDRERVRQLYRTTNSLGGLGTTVVGMFHSQIYKEDEIRSHGLSESDIEFFIDEMGKLDRKDSAQLTLGVREKTYKNPGGTGKRIIQYPKKLRVLLRLEPRLEFDISIAAYKLTLDGRVREMRAIWNPNGKTNIIPFLD
ncbi:MAG: hypothetical protein AABW46_03260 [Nanoarchaeota archaeon]